MQDFLISSSTLHLLVVVGPLNSQEKEQIKQNSTKADILSPETGLTQTSRDFIKRYKQERWIAYCSRSGTEHVFIPIGNKPIEARISCELQLLEHIDYAILHVLINLAGNQAITANDFANTMTRVYYKEIYLEKKEPVGSRSHLRDILKTYLEGLSLRSQIIQSILDDLPYPIIVIHDYQPSTLSPAELVQSFKKDVFGLMIHPSYGINNLSKLVFEPRLPHNYFYSDLIYQDFHLRGAVMICQQSIQPETVFYARYESEFVRAFMISRLLWFSFQDAVAAKGRTMGAQGWRRVFFRSTDPNLAMTYLLASLQYNGSSQVYRDILKDTSTVFGTAGGLDEIATFLQSISDDAFRARIEQLGVVATLIGTVLALAALFHL